MLDSIFNKPTGKFNCFTIESPDVDNTTSLVVEALSSYCGNRQVEDLEQCDCGIKEVCESDTLGDSCCNSDPDGELGCTLKPGASCRFRFRSIFHCILLNTMIK